MNERTLFILASESPRRRELLQKMRLMFEVRPACCDECLQQGESPEVYTRRLARDKAEAVGRGVPDIWVLAADTVVVSDGRILGKPGDRDEARVMLFALSGRVHKVVTSFCWYHGGQKTRYVQSVESQVEFKSLTKDEIERYVRSDEPMDKAGAYAVQGLGSFMVRAVRGSYSNVVGLPLAEVIEAMIELGIISGFPLVNSTAANLSEEWSGKEEPCVFRGGAYDKHSR